MSQNIKKDLNNVLEWSKAKIRIGNEPPWAWYQYMKLNETIEAILKGMASIESYDPTKGCLQQSAKHQGSGLRLVENMSEQDESRPRQGIDEIPMPM
jgi:hypothetical protein